MARAPLILHNVACELDGDLDIVRNTELDEVPNNELYEPKWNMIPSGKATGTTEVSSGRHARWSNIGSDNDDQR
jgi:hypothetical protein